MFAGFSMTAAQQTLLAKCVNGSVLLTLTAAALCAMQGISNHALDTGMLQSALRKSGITIHIDEL